MTRLDKFVIAIFAIVAIIVGAQLQRPSGFDPMAGRRPVPPPSDARALPPIKPNVPDRVRRPPIAPPSPADPTFIVEGADQPRSKTGTAFSVDPRGVWFTARHVVHGCARLFVESTWGRVPAVIADAHPSADFAVIQSGRSGPALVLSDGPPELGEDGFSLGFPAGRLGAAQGQLIGRARMSSRGGINGITPTLSWAELRRVPESLDSLGGLSGGPMFDATGAVVGVVVAESQRRGRVFTVAPELLREALDELPSGLPAPARTRLAEIAAEPNALALNAQRAAQDSRIVRVVCFAS